MSREIERLKSKQADRRALKQDKDTLFKKASELKLEIKKRDREWRSREQELVDSAEAVYTVVPSPSSAQPT